MPRCPASPLPPRPNDDRPAGQPPFLLDIFCGRADIARACISAGLAACAIGYYAPSPSGLVPFVNLDLTLDWARLRALDVIRCKHSSAIVWMAPPCGTLSFAREKPLPKRLALAGCKPTGPLRSARYLCGLPSAKIIPAVAEKLARANRLVDFVFEAMRVAHGANRHWFVMNPRRSYLWQFPQWRDIRWHEVNFDACEFGGARKIPQRLRCSSDWLAHLSRCCQGGHVHAFGPATPSSGRPSSGPRTEDILPEQFCSAVAAALAKQSNAAKGTPTTGEALSLFSYAEAAAPKIDENKRRVALLSASAGWQSRGRRLHALVPEYKRKRRLDISTSDANSLTKRQRLKPSFKLGGHRLRKESQVIAIDEGLPGCRDSIQVTLGEAWTPEEFLEEARGCEHPFASVHAPDEITRAVFVSLTEGPKGVKDIQ